MSLADIAKYKIKMITAACQFQDVSEIAGETLDFVWRQSFMPSPVVVTLRE